MSRSSSPRPRNGLASSLLGASLLATSILVAGCGGGGGGGSGGGGGGGGGSSAQVSGHVVFDTGGAAARLRVASLAVAREEEPNDSLDTATRLGFLRAGGALARLGHGTANDASDPFDGFEVAVEDRALVTVRTTSLSSDAAFALAVYDPTGLQFVRSARADADGVATLTFAARGTFDVVVTASRGEGDYRLDVSARPLAQVDATTDATPALVGDLRVGDAVVLASAPANLPATGPTPGAPVVAAPAAPAAPSAPVAFLASCPSAVRLAVTPAGGLDTVVDVFDATEDGERGAPLARLVGPGEVEIDAGTLVRLEFAGSTDGAARTVSVRGIEPLADRAGSRLEKGLGLAPLAAEARHVEARRPGVAFGRPTLRFTSGKMIVKCEAGAADALAPEFARRATRVLEQVDEASCVVTFDVPSALGPEDRARSTFARVASLRALGGVAAVSPSFRRTAKKVPNDSRYGEQWDLPLIHLPEAWNVTTGSSSVIVAVIDTGSTAHPDVAGHNGAGYDFISDVATAGDGGGRDSDPTDVGDGENGEPGSYHGTHVSGTIGAVSNNGQGIAGCNWNVTLMPLRVLGIGGGDDADIIAAIRYAAGLTNASGKLPAKRANVINMSLGGGGFDQTFQDAVTAARDAGVVIFAAAGNDGSTAKEYPASFDGVVSVAAVDRDKKHASYSNTNSSVDLAAPGGDSTASEANGVLSTIYDDSVSPKVATYAFYDGTSMATPHAAGVAALVLSVAPSLTPAQVESILQTTAEDLGTAGRDNTYGYGLVNAYQAVLKAQGGATGAPLLSLGSTSMTFTDGTNSLDASISNAGGGLLTVTSATAATTSGGAWLSATITGAGDATRSAATVRVTVARGALADGDYTGTVTVASNGGSQGISVTLTIGTPSGGGGAPGDVDVYVLVVDAETGDTVDDFLVPAGGDTAFEFDGLPAGSYYFAAGSDESDDGYIGDAGDWYGEGDVFDLSRGSSVGDLEVVVSLSSGSFARVRVGPDRTILARR